MNFKKQFGRIGVASVLLLFTSLARAEDECRDALTNPAYDITDFRSEQSVDLYNVTQINTKKDDSRSQRNSFSYGGFAVGTDDQKRLQSSLDYKNEFKLMTENRESLLLYHGSDKIMDAWSKCMFDKKGGMMVVFRPQSDPFGEDVILHIEYREPVGPHAPLPPLKLTSDVVLPAGFEVIGDQPNFDSCLRKNKVFVPGQTECNVHFRVRSLWTSGLVKLNLASGNYTPQPYAFLIPRPKLLSEIRPWISNQSASASCWGDAHCTGFAVLNADPGFIILQDPAPQVHDTGRSFNTSNCGAVVSVDPGGASASLNVGTGTNYTLDHHLCEYIATGTEMRIYWDSSPNSGR